MSRAPDLVVSRWFNAEAGLSLSSLRERVVLLHAFQMLCPGCVSHGLPQAARVRALFDPADVAVIGMHSVFEHHAVMGPEALAVFLHEYRIDYPVGVDAHVPGDPLPRTLRAYGWRGTPSLTLIDRAGRVRWSPFGRVEDVQLGAMIGRLFAETACDEDGCRVPT